MKPSVAPFLRAPGAVRKIQRGIRSPWFRRLACGFLLCLAPLAAAQGRASGALLDSDGDGLSDGEELDKYLTNPFQADSDGNRIPDGEWNERRQFTTTIRAVVRVLAPCFAEAGRDLWQDWRPVGRGDAWVDLECIAYLGHRGFEPRRLPDYQTRLLFYHPPSRLPASEHWKEEARGQEEWLRPRKACNWDAELRDSLRQALAVHNRVLDRHSDVEVVEILTTWLLSGSRCVGNASLPFAMDFRGATPRLHPDLSNDYEARRSPLFPDAGEYGAEMLCGKAMWQKRRYEGGLSWCIYAATVLRAFGIPTRFALFVPLIDLARTNQMEYLAAAITHPGLRRFLADNVRRAAAAQPPDGQQPVAMNEVFVGGRWVLLHLPTGGQGLVFPAAPLMDGATPGLLLRVATFADPSEMDFPATWGRQAAGLSVSPELPGKKAWRLRTLSYHVGAHNRLFLEMTNSGADEEENDPAWAANVDASQRRMLLAAGCWEPPMDVRDVLRLRILPRRDAGNGLIERPASERRVYVPGLSYDFFPDSEPWTAANTNHAAIARAKMATRPEPRPREPVAARREGVARALAYRIVQVFWSDAPERPAALPPPPSSLSGNGGRLFFAKIQRESGTTADDEIFLRFSSREFLLKRPGSEALPLDLLPFHAGEYFLFRVPAGSLGRMAPGVPWRLYEGQQVPGCRWTVHAEAVLKN